MTKLATSRRLQLAVAALSAVLMISACGDDGESSSPEGDFSGPPPANSAVAVSEQQIDDAIDRVPELAEGIMSKTKIPGLAVAVVRGGDVAFAEGFGVREVGKNSKVDADTVFQIASLSKSVGATVIAEQVGKGVVQWDTPVRQNLPSFTMSDPWISDHVTIADMYTHRSGLPLHAGDILEDLGYGQQDILSKLAQEPIEATNFRVHDAYTNFGITAAAESVSVAAGTDWATLSQNSLYGPLGMTNTSSRFADYMAHTDRAIPHTLVGDKYQPKFQRDPDAQTPAGGVSSTVNDLAKWMNLVLAGGVHNGQPLVEKEPLVAAFTSEFAHGPGQDTSFRSGTSGYGVNVSTTSSGRVINSHSGAFNMGAATNYVMIPSLNVGIVALSNAGPIGAVEALTAEFVDLVQYGKITRDWVAGYAQLTAEPAEGELAGKQRPADAAPPGPLPRYAGTYANPYWGEATVAPMPDGNLQLIIGPDRVRYTLTPWSGDTWTFIPTGEMPNPGTVSQATFNGSTVVLEYFDDNGLGTFTKS